MADNIGVHWFRLDLRLADNPSIENLSKNVASIMPIYIHDENQNIGQASKCWLEKSLKSLNTVLRMFPSVQAFKGGSFDDMIKGYDSMMSDLDVLTKLFQRLIKTGEMSSLTVRNLYKGIMEFSKGLEELFGVKSKIEDKPAPEVADKPAEEAEGEVDTDGDKFSDEEEKQAKTDPEDPQSLPDDTDKDGASDAAEDAAATDKEDPESKPEEAKVFKALPEIQKHIQFGVEVPDADCPRQKRHKRKIDDDTFDDLLHQSMNILRKQCELHGLDAPFVASRAEVRHLIYSYIEDIDEPLPIKQGWRGNIAGKHIIELLNKASIKTF